jgi:hypothetical protein
MGQTNVKRHQRVATDSELPVRQDDHTNLLSYKAQYSLKKQTALFEIGKRRKYGEKPFFKV